MIVIDGSMGEGGGQILRSALTLSLVTGQPISITSIRAGRKKPGLRPQHLAAARAAAAIGQARLTGDALGSRELTFEPGGVKGGEHRFEVGTAGSTSLVLQTIFLPLALGNSPSQVTITGGTHVPWSPSYHYLAGVWLPMMRRIGLEAELSWSSAGYYPAGGGEIRARIQPSGPIQPLDLRDRGELRRVEGVSLVSNLPRHIAERQRRRAEQMLASLEVPIAIEEQQPPSPGKGTAVCLQARFDHSIAGFTGLGAPGKPAERVADEAVSAFWAFLHGDGAVDRYLADQILLPLALARGESRYRTEQFTRHLLTQAAVIRAFALADIAIPETPDWLEDVIVRPR